MSHRWYSGPMLAISSFVAGLLVCALFVNLTLVTPWHVHDTTIDNLVTYPTFYQGKQVTVWGTIELVPGGLVAVDIYLGDQRPWPLSWMGRSSNSWLTDSLETYNICIGDECITGVQSHYPCTAPLPDPSGTYIIKGKWYWERYGRDFVLVLDCPIYARVP